MAAGNMEFSPLAKAKKINVNKIKAELSFKPALSL